jgi:hypothetical protein
MITICPCGIAADDCDYHKPEPETVRIPESIYRWDEVNQRWYVVGDPIPPVDGGKFLMVGDGGRDLIWVDGPGGGGFDDGSDD